MATNQMWNPTTDPMTQAEEAVIELTQAEKDLIIAQRRQKEAEDAAKAAQEEVDKVKKLAIAEKKAVESQTVYAQLEVAYRNWFSQLQYEAGNTTTYQLNITPTSTKFEADNGRYGENRVIYGVKEKPINRCQIKYVGDPNYAKRDDFTAIIVKIVHDNGVYKVQISGINDSYSSREKSYKTAKKVHEKITEYLINKTREKQAIENRKSLQEQTVDALKALYPEAEVKKSTYSSSSYYHGRRTRNPVPTEVAAVLVIHPNELHVTYSLQANTDGTPKLTVYKIASENLDEAAKLIALIAVPKKVKAPNA